MTLTEYNDYFEDLAARHAELSHSAQECHFTRGELEEFFQNFRSKVQFPCMILEASECSYNIPSLATATRERSGAFIIADTYGLRKDYDDVQAALQRCERIAEDIVRIMAFDCDRETDAPFASLRNVSLVYLQNQQLKYAGARVEFTVAGAMC